MGENHGCMVGESNPSRRSVLRKSAALGLAGPIGVLGTTKPADASLTCQFADPDGGEYLDSAEQDFETEQDYHRLITKTTAGHIDNAYSDQTDRVEHIINFVTVITTDLHQIDEDDEARSIRSNEVAVEYTGDLSTDDVVLDFCSHTTGAYPDDDSEVVDIVFEELAGIAIGAASGTVGFAVDVLQTAEAIKDAVDTDESNEHYITSDAEFGDGLAVPTPYRAKVQGSFGLSRPEGEAGTVELTSRTNAWGDDNVHEWDDRTFDATHQEKIYIDFWGEDSVNIHTTPTW